MSDTLPAALESEDERLARMVKEAKSRRFREKQSNKNKAILRMESHMEIPLLNILDGISSVLIAESDSELVSFAKEICSKSSMARFPPIQFLVWEDRLFKEPANVLLLAELQAGRGLVVREGIAGGQEFFHVTVSQLRSSVILGSIMHTSGATMYHVEKITSEHFNILPVSVRSEGKYEVTIKKTFCLRTAKFVGLTTDDRKFQLRRNGVVVSLVQRKLCFGMENGFTVHYRERFSKDIEIRCLSLGLGLLMTLLDSASGLDDVLRESMRF